MKKLIDILIDPDNHDNILLYDEDGIAREFAQAGLIHNGRGTLYAILEPIWQGATEGELIVFRVEENGDDVSLMAEPDEEVANAVFNEFLRGIKETQG